MRPTGVYAHIHMYIYQHPHVCVAMMTTRMQQQHFGHQSRVGLLCNIEHAVISQILCKPIFPKKKTKKNTTKKLKNGAYQINRLLWSTVSLGDLRPLPTTKHSLSPQKGLEPRFCAAILFVYFFMSLCFAHFLFLLVRRLANLHTAFEAIENVIELPQSPFRL